MDEFPVKYSIELSSVRTRSTAFPVIIAIVNVKDCIFFILNTPLIDNLLGAL